MTSFEALSKTFLARIINAVADPIFVKDEAHRWILLNEAMCRFMGRPADALLGRSDFDFFPEAEAKVFWQTDAEVFATGIPNLNVESFTDASGVLHTISTKKALFQESDGRKVLVGIIRDVTQEKTLERELIAAREAALTAAATKAAFLANMSHELRTPMNGVIGMTELLLGTTLSAEQRELADVIRKSGDYLLSIINAILEFSKLEAGHVHLERRDFNLRETVEQVLGLVAPGAQEKGLELACVVARDVPPIVSGDPERLSEVLLNLLGNGLKFTDAGHLTLSVWLAEQRPTESVLRFEVRDSGVGFARADVERLFVAFSQLDSSATRRHGGTGLGLAISRQLVDMMGGTIEVNSAPGRGSTFTFSVALGRPALELPEPARALWCRRALVVNRHVVQAQLLVQQLAAHDVAAVIAGDGEDLVARIRSAREGGAAFDVVLVAASILDEGAGLAAALRAELDLAGTPLVLLTRLGAPTAVLPGDPRAPATAIAKPVMESKLLAALHQLDPRRAHPGATPTPAPRASSRVPHRATRILVVEDNVINQRVIAKMLDVLGHGVEVEENGARAIAVAAKLRCDAILMDCHMPEMDGYQASREIRARERGRRVPIIAMTASASEADRQRCLEHGMDDYIAKPVRLETLREKLEHWLTPRDAG